MDQLLFRVFSPSLNVVACAMTKRDVRNNEVNTLLNVRSVPVHA